MNRAGDARSPTSNRRVDALTRGDRSKEVTTTATSQNPAIKLWTALSSSQNCLLARKAIRWLQSSGKEHSLYIHIPSRVGHSPCLDLALTANMEAWSIDLGEKSVSEEHCYQTSTLATGALHSLMNKGPAATSDEAMLTVALLFSFESSVRAWSFERTRGPVDHAAMLHMKGLAAMFTSRPPEPDCSSLYRALWYAMSFYVAFILQLFSAEGSSPFEDSRWLDLDPPADDSERPLQDYLRSLLKTSNKLFICLPRLIKLVQKARHAQDETTHQATIKVATLIHGLKEAHAEDRLLHSVNVVKTSDRESPGKELLPYVFKFATYTEYEAALAYWTTRLNILQQCHWLCNITSLSVPFTAEDIEKEGSRTAKNIMMSWESILSYKPVTKMRGSIALQAVWGSFEHFRVVKEEEDLETVKLWILKRSNELSGETCVLTEHHMDGFAALQRGDGIWLPQMGVLNS